MKYLALSFLILVGCAHQSIPQYKAPDIALKTGDPTGHKNTRPRKLSFDIEEEETPEPPVVVDCKTSPCRPFYSLSGEISEKSAKRAIDYITAAQATDAKRILIEIDTPGGEVAAGFALAKVIERSKIPVHCVVDVTAASMGAAILQSCQVRMMTPRAVLMFHEPSLSGAMSGHPNEWQSTADGLKAIRASLAHHCVARMNVSYAYYRYRTDGGLQWWMSSDDAMTYHAVDQLVKNVQDLM